MAREGFAVSGIDGSSTAIKQATDRLAREGLTANRRVGDYSILLWPDSSLDGIVENISPYCNRRDAVKRALDEIRRVLKPDAPFLSSFFTDRTWARNNG
jgi:ubiquinone/menaquinone biosynthesis C-methylase UbiE